MVCVTGDIAGLIANINVWVLFVISHGLTVRIELYFTSEVRSAQSVVCNLRDIFVNSKWLNTKEGASHIGMSSVTPSWLNYSPIRYLAKSCCKALLNSGAMFWLASAVAGLCGGWVLVVERLTITFLMFWNRTSFGALYGGGGLCFVSSACTLTFRHRASSVQDRRFATLQRTLFIYLINKYISLSDICLTVHHWYK